METKNKNTQMETKQKTIGEKLLDFQNSIEAIKKDGKNSFFKKPNGKESTYATLPNILSEVKPILNALKIVVLQPIKDNVVYTVLLCTETGEEVSSGVKLPDGLNAQQTGSAITYFRRYTLCSLLALEIEEDDDGNSASQLATEKEWLNKFTDKTNKTETENWQKVVKSLKEGYTIQQVESKYRLSTANKAELINIQNGNL